MWHCSAINKSDAWIVHKYIQKWYGLQPDLSSFFSWQYFCLFSRYRCLLRGQVIKQSHLPSDVCAMILATLGPSYKDEYQIGATKVIILHLHFLFFSRYFNFVSTHFWNGSWDVLYVRITGHFFFLSRNLYVCKSSVTKRNSCMCRVIFIFAVNAAIYLCFTCVLIVLLEF